MPEMPANGRLLRFWQRSSGSRFRQRRGEIAKSLWPNAEIFPFSGDDGRRPGSIYTAWPSLQCNARILVFKAATGEEIGVEFDEVTATKWASQIVTPKPQD